MAAGLTTAGIQVGAAAIASDITKIRLHTADPTAGSGTTNLTSAADAGARGIVGVRLVGMHPRRAALGAARSGGGGLGRSGRVLDRALADRARWAARPGDRVRVVPVVRCGEAGSSALGRSTFQGRAGNADRLARRLRHSVRRL